MKSLVLIAVLSCTAHAMEKPNESTIIHVEPTREESFIERVDHAEEDYNHVAACCCRIASGSVYFMGSIAGYASAVLAGLSIDQSFDEPTRKGLAVGAVITAAVAGFLHTIKPAIDKLIEDKKRNEAEAHSRIEETHKH